MTGKRMGGLKARVQMSLRGLLLFIQGCGRLMGGIMYVSQRAVVQVLTRIDKLCRWRVP
jgi:hypothetical protein